MVLLETQPLAQVNTTGLTTPPCLYGLPSSCFFLLEGTPHAFFGPLARHPHWWMGRAISFRHRCCASFCLFFRTPLSIACNESHCYIQGEIWVAGTLKFFIGGWRLCVWIVTVSWGVMFKWCIPCILETQVGIYPGYIDQKVKQFPPPDLTFSRAWVVGSQLVCSIYSSHVFCVADSLWWSCHLRFFAPTHAVIFWVPFKEVMFLIPESLVASGQKLNHFTILPDYRC